MRRSSCGVPRVISNRLQRSTTMMVRGGHSRLSLMYQEGRTLLPSTMKVRWNIQLRSLLSRWQDLQIGTGGLTRPLEATWLLGRYEAVAKPSLTSPS
mmetsp:Transcript_24424/g.58074  ORF Transcript_24424/g.58074 Transcript_24424/m.58074 type:complete len:97 (-) Transcript_24424:3-293(-)